MKLNLSKHVWINIFLLQKQTNLVNSDIQNFYSEILEFSAILQEKLPIFRPAMSYDVITTQRLGRLYIVYWGVK